MLVVSTGAGKDHVGKITGLIVALARHRFGLMHARPRFNATIELPQSFIGRPARAIEMDRNVDAMILHSLKAADGLAEDTRVRVYSLVISKISWQAPTL